ncbi:ribose-5-phosphate isomerase RpiA [Streptococcus sp. H49]|uniref:ribose-5-phosphate isomerase RpiA n=1 Tax=Streptococcus huangxiaojuni TaxID=3237239 RepID=UPI0034A4309C
MEELKKQAGIAAAQYVSDGMIIGLGTGSTARHFVDEIGRRVQEDGLQITGVTTSSQTTAQAESLGIPLKDINTVRAIDLTVDGADEVDSDFNGIKGGGGALLMEKIVATLTKRYIWVVDETKLVTKLGSFKLPIEVVQYGAECLFRHFQDQGYQPAFREYEGERFVTDMQNYIIDLDLKRIENPQALADSLDHTVGVVEHGLFNGMVDQVIVAGKDGIKHLNAPKK